VKLLARLMLIQGQPDFKSTFQENIMSALLKYETFESHSAEAETSKNTWEPVLYTIVRRPRAEKAESAEVKGAASTAKNITLFLASPFIGLAYIAAMPFVALGALAYFGVKALFNKVPVAKHVAMMAAAPVIGLAFVVAAPFIGIGALGYYGTKAIAKN
jgi:hypothetical protein